MVLQDINTACYNKLNITIILINNDVYQIEYALNNKKYNYLHAFNYKTIINGMGCKNVITCDIDNFKEKLNYINSKNGFGLIVLKISHDDIDDLMKNWANLVSKYTTKYSPNK